MTTNQFNRLSKAKKAVLVAEDALLQIKAKKYFIKKGNYIHNLQIIGTYKKTDEINEKFDNIKKCECCALGSMLLSCTHLGNNLKIRDVITKSPFTERLNSGVINDTNSKINSLFSSIFDSKQLLLIENAFEGYGSFNNVPINEIKLFYKEDFEYFEHTRYSSAELTFEETLQCTKFYRKYKNDENRMKAICNNIIKNNGKFII